MLSVTAILFILRAVSEAVRGSHRLSTELLSKLSIKVSHNDMDNCTCLTFEKCFVKSTIQVFLYENKFADALAFIAEMFVMTIVFGLSAVFVFYADDR